MGLVTSFGAAAASLPGARRRCSIAATARQATTAVVTCVGVCLLPHPALHASKAWTPFHITRLTSAASC